MRWLEAYVIRCHEERGRFSGSAQPIGRKVVTEVWSQPWVNEAEAKPPTYEELYASLLNIYQKLALDNLLPARRLEEGLRFDEVYGNISSSLAENLRQFIEKAEKFTSPFLSDQLRRCALIELRKTNATLQRSLTRSQLTSTGAKIQNLARKLRTNLTVLQEEGEKLEVIVTKMEELAQDKIPDRPDFREKWFPQQSCGLPGHALIGQLWECRHHETSSKGHFGDAGRQASWNLGWF